MGMPQSFNPKNPRNMKYFTLRELTKSDTAIRKGIDNTPSGLVRSRLTELVANVLDPLREAYGKPIRVTSGYRCAKLNKIVGGAARSAHMYGYAADITTIPDTFKDNKKLFDLILSQKLPFDKLIWEMGNDAGPDWIHISYVAGANRKQILRARRTANGTTYETYKP